jgi:hypothetical protein
MPNDDISIQHDIRRCQQEMLEANQRGDKARVKTLKAFIKSRRDALNRVKRNTWRGPY